ncbi:MAG: hypothetical protein A2Z77_09390 [Chloroflexi bacterium RBG_13_51_36]|nr:MAG: hypothetical protein A2Z77_09390 [Chloroflexi bacterium RBG_13_51_36]
MKKEKIIPLFLVLVVVGALLFSSVSALAGANPGHGKSLGEARKALEQELLSQAGAAFVGITHSENEGEVILFVEDEQAKQKMPRSFDGYKVRTEVTGKIQAFSTQVAEPLIDVSDERKAVVRPLVGGTSLSAYVTKGQAIYQYSGTLGMITYDDKVLSNAHVIAMNPETGAFLPTGTPILQPGTGDGGRPPDERVGELEAYIPISFDPGVPNYADAAIGSIDYGVEASPGRQFSETGDYWIQDWTNVSEGNTVRKSGRTTGVTTAEVLHTNVSVRVYYGDEWAYFEDQITVEQENWSFAGPGDSGSAVDKNGKFVGLLFAGSADSAVICKAQHIIDGLGIALEPTEGQYSLTISGTPGGSTTPNEGRHFYDPGTVVNLVAVPAEHYHFVEWTGDVGTIGNRYAASTAITMNGSYSITAEFELDPGWYGLIVSSTLGGSVATPGEGIFVYAANATVGLVAVNETHCHFAEWTGDVSTVGNVTAPATTITMNASYSVTADFELDPGWYRLTTSSTEGGTVTTPGEGNFVYAANTTVPIAAEPDEGYKFLKWTGNVSTIADIYAASTTVTMNASYSITALFDWLYPEATEQLIISSTSGGSVIVPGEGTKYYSLGEKVTLVAQPDEGHEFIRWSGDVDTIFDVYAASTTITMDMPYSITANFSGGGLCFIATAVSGTPMAEEIQVLREFRDGFMLTNPAGRALVDFYYRVSPPVAEFISEHPGAGSLVRVALLPAIAMSTIVVNTSPAEKGAVAALVVLAAVAVAIWATRRRSNTGIRLKANGTIGATLPRAVR